MIVELKQGLIKGGEDESLITGRKFNTFYGIPYGVAPLGKLRFKPPIPAGKWVGTFEAAEPRDWSDGRGHSVTPENVALEDCLFLNVFTPQEVVVPEPEPAPVAEPPPTTGTLKRSRFGGLFGEVEVESITTKVEEELIFEEPPLEPPKPPKPVMVYLCRGQFGHNEKSTVHFDNLVDYDVILVTVCYRQGIFGYLNLNVQSCAGNCACKDVVLSLQWIKDNIGAFGGNPYNVTVYGEGGAAVIINLLNLSLMSKGLFEKAIVLGGSVLSPGVFNDDQVDVAFEIASSFQFAGEEPEEVAEFLRDLPAMTLLAAAEKQQTKFIKEHPFIANGLLVLFTPSREKFKDGAFLYDHPVDLMRTALAVPMIVGVAEKEGVPIVTRLAEEDSRAIRPPLDPLSDLIKFNNIPCDPTDIDKVAMEARIFYLQRHKNDTAFESRFIDLYSDFINLKFYESFQHVTKSTEPLYLYEFAYIGSLNESKIWAEGLIGTYAAHADENSYVNLCRGFFPQPRVDAADKEMIRKMCTWYTNFARTGNPNPETVDETESWQPHTEESPCYMRIDLKSRLMRARLFEKGRSFWNYIWRTYIP